MDELDTPSKMAQLHIGVEGWCTINKAMKLYEIASLPDVILGLEIGIFGGKSFFPVCQAFKDKGAGLHYGIEPWSNAVAVETATNSLNDEWWAKLDFPAIKRGFFQHMINFDLLQYGACVEAPSDSAYNLFSTHRFYQKIDLLHIDGAHSTPEALHDVTNWTKLVRPGGYVVLDDINWPTVGLAYEYLKTLGEELYSSLNEADGFFSIVKMRS